MCDSIYVSWQYLARMDVEIVETIQYKYIGTLRMTFAKFFFVCEITSTDFLSCIYTLAQVLPIYYRCPILYTILIFEISKILVIHVIRGGHSVLSRVFSRNYL